MTPGTWARISELFDLALQRSGSEREALLAELGRTDAAAAREVASLLEAHERPGEFLPDLPAPSEPPDLTGRVVGAYRLLRLLGAGGTGWVFKARHQHLQRLVAVKLLRHELLKDPEVLARFYQEIQIVSQLGHANVVHAYDAGPIGGNHVLVMEYAEGVDLARLVRRRGPLPSPPAPARASRRSCAG